MTNIDIVKRLFHLVNSVDISRRNFDGKILSISEKPEISTIISDIKASGIEIEQSGTTFELKLNKEVNNLLIFYNEDDFIKRFPNFKHLNADIALITYENSFLFYDHDANSCADANGTCLNNIFVNFYDYLRLIDYIKLNTNLISVHKEDCHEFIIINPGSEKGFLSLVYNTHEKRIKSQPQFGTTIEILKDKLKAEEYLCLFKVELDQFLNKIAPEDRFLQFVQSLSLLIQNADKAYDLYLRKFSFDKIKSQFKEERNKYFETLDKSLEKIYKQVSSLPLTFAATAFAAYQTKDSGFILILILFAYLIYTIIALYILSISKSEIIILKKDVTDEELKIRADYNIIYQEFKQDFIKVYSRISKIDTLIFIIKSALIGLISLFGAFVFFKLTQITIHPLSLLIKLILSILT